MEKLAIFDVDFTLTSKETLLQLFKFLIKEDKKNLKFLPRAAFSGIIDMMKKLKSEGYKIYLISASPEFYLNELYNIKEVDVIIGTRFSFNEGKFERKMVGENCKGEEKVRRLKEYLQENNIEVDYKNSYMFSDSLSDKPLLDLVGNGYLINYKKNNKDYKILNWK